jgi:glycolate oxidase
MRELFGFMDEERVLTSPEEILTYSYDATRHRSLPGIILRPVSKEEVVDIVKIASREALPIVPRGAGTSLSGGPVPIKGGIVLDLTLMDRIKEVDVENSLVTLEPGVIYDGLNKALEEYGLFFPPDPGSGKVCTVGGMVANNSSGLRAVKYGTTKDYVSGLEVVLSMGEVIKIGTKARKSSSGYDLIGIFVGSEGTLGVFTEITLRVIQRPTDFATARVGFTRMEDAGRAVRKIISAGLRPAVLEIMDTHTLRAVERYMGQGFPEVEALLLLEMDGFDDGVKKRLKKGIRLCRGEGAALVEEAKSGEEREILWKARKASLPALARYKPTLILEDVTVPISALPKMMRAIGRIGKKHGVEIATFGHAGDGNLHPTLLVDRRNKEELQKAERAMEELFLEAIELRGTLSGEHGIGLEKKDFIGLEHRDAMELMRGLKKVLDPEGIMNPGKIL